MKLKSASILLLSILSQSAILTAAATAQDSLTVEQAIQLTLNNHPAVRQAQQQVKSAEALAQAQRSFYYPDISALGLYSRLGPVETISIGNGETFELYPANNYDAHLELRQKVYDFGERGTSVQVAEASVRTAGDNVEIIKSSLAYGTISAFNSVLIFQQSIAVLEDEIAALNQHLEITQKKVQAGTATEFDVLTTQVRIAVANDQLIDARNNLQDQEITLRQLTGLTPDQAVTLKGEFDMSPVSLSPDSLFAVARMQRPELVASRDAETGAELRTRLVSLSDRPSLDVALTAGFKTGYIPNLNTLKGNYTAGIEVQVPVFNGGRTRHQTSAAEASFQAARDYTADVERRVYAEVDQAIAAVNSAFERISNAEVQITQAEKAVSLAKVQYEAGVVTNLDVLDAQTALSGARLIRLKALYMYTMSLSGLDQATGKRIW